MCWDDQDLGEKVSTVVADPTVSDAELVDVAVLCAAKAAARNDVHELCEFFVVDGARVFDPHPHGRRYDDAPVTVDVFGPAERIPPWDGYRFAAGELVEVEDRVVSRIAAELAERVSAGPLGRFEVSGTQMSHVGVYPDRCSGELREFHWTREWACDVVVADAGNIAAATRSALVASMFMLAAESLVHEVAEWLTVDGARPFDPHPRGCFQSDVLRTRLRTVTSALVPLRRPEGAAV
jgi:hypothetical protein